ncbi:MAG TPA: trypsin-like peptidase domain-containing protein [Methylophilaceae bacterium]
MRYLLLLIASLSYLPSAFALDQEKLLDSFFSVVMIRGYNTDGGMSYGSGVIVAPNKVLTDCHIFRQSKQPWVSRGEDTYTISSVQADRYYDMCLVTADNLPYKAAVLGTASTLKKGEQVLAIGFSNGMPAPLTAFGELKSLYPLNGGNIIRTNARFALGASGSGLFDDKGHLIGINTFKTPGQNAYFYALPIEWLAELQKQPIETSFPINGKTFWEEEEAQKPFFMQIAVPEIQEDWPKLAEIAELWTKSEPNNTEAWYELGLANERMGRADVAEKAYRKSVAIDASNSDSLFRIGVIASEKGNAKEVHDINLVLLDLNKDLAEEFSKAVGCKTEC